VYVVLAAMIGIISNVIRICIVVLIGYYFGMSHELVQDHDSIGWIVFTLHIFPFLLLGERALRKRGVKRSGGGESISPMQSALGYKMTGFLSVVFAFSLGPGLNAYFNTVETNQISDHVSANFKENGWQQVSSNLVEWRPLWSEGDRTFQGKFTRENDVVELYATQFLRQQDGREAVNISHRVYDIDKWSRISRSAKVISYGDSGEMTVEETLLKSPENKLRLVWRWYLANDRFIQSDMEAKLSNLVGTLNGRPDISVYILSKEIVKSDEHATHVLSDFVHHYLDI
jgi:EpsI family protein